MFLRISINIYVYISLKERKDGIDWQIHLVVCRVEGI